MYVRCINNKQYLKQPDFEDNEIIPDLVIEQIYKVVPDKKRKRLSIYLSWTNLVKITPFPPITLSRPISAIQIAYAFR